MNNPTLIIMAAGMGSRYGGLKQMDPVGSHGEIIVDFSLYDAMMAGFENVIFIIKEEMEEDMRALMDSGAARHLKIDYAFQKTEDLPDGFSVPSGRVKPWGTCHAVMAASQKVQGAFAVINADDYYGPHAFRLLYEYLQSAKDDDKKRFAMVGYLLPNTLTEYGSVARGVCKTDEEDFLTEIEERLKIVQKDGAIFYADNNDTWIPLSPAATVSMNCWAFTPSFMQEIVDGFPAFLSETLLENPLKGEYLLPRKIDELIKQKKATVKVLRSEDHWYGVTYAEDKPHVIAALQSLKDKGLYPEKLW
ncbi:MAG: nucleotidyltransferase [Clostridiales Family XIII bacterium]|jgi:dTDP-glucose pyrophosphorylase|nr:nucleotidyltransferase [Clostridiales Family XIII bacterium]